MRRKAENDKKFTIKEEVILASESKTRINQISKYIKEIKVVKHRLDEDAVKAKIKDPIKLAQEIAKCKAMSVKHLYPDSFIIGSDQVLVCDQKIYNKPKNLDEAKNNLISLKNKIHFLVSSIYVLRKTKLFFQQTKKAQLFLKNIKNADIINYVDSNPVTALSTVGSYKIEENDKFNFLDIISGDMETIIGFPTNDFVKAFYNEK